MSNFHGVDYSYWGRGVSQGIFNCQSYTSPTCRGGESISYHMRATKWLQDSMPIQITNILIHIYHTEFICYKLFDQITPLVERYKTTVYV